jgi:hypothetical protein
MLSLYGPARPRAHRHPVTPVWGQINTAEIGDGETHPRGIERRVNERVFAIAEYLRSVQRK